MAKKKASFAKRAGAAIRSVLQSITRAKSGATGRVWDELHNAESRILRATEGRKSSFNRAAKRGKKQTPGRTRRKGSGNAL